MHVDQQTPCNRVSAVSSSAFLMRFAHACFCGRIRPQSGQTLPGLGGDSDLLLSRLATLSCPSDSEPVALALTIDGTDCSCSANYRTPTKRDWKGMSAKKWRERAVGDNTPTLPDQIGGPPLPEFVEVLMGFPEGWTTASESKPSVMPLTLASPSGSADES
jgi:hypothetical protein